jgi:hypothetical protein
MRVCTSLFILLAAFCCGCSSDHFIAGHGDVGEFILQQAVVHGGSPATNSLPILSDRWRYSEDKDGVVIQMAREKYPAVEAFLRQAFGEPTFGPTETSSGGKLGGYRLSAKGGAIQFGYETQRTQIIIIRPMSTDEIMQATVKAFSESK